MILEGLLYITGLLFGIAGPLAVAHYGRASHRRLDRPLVAVAAAVPVILGAVVVRDFRVGGHGHGLFELLADFVSGVVLGLLVGFFGLAAYGVIERLVLPRMAGD